VGEWGLGIRNWVEIAWCFIKQISLNVELNLKYSLFFFASRHKCTGQVAQKRTKKGHQKTMYSLPLFAGQAVFWEEVRLGFGTTVVNSLEP